MFIPTAHRPFITIFHLIARFIDLVVTDATEDSNATVADGNALQAQDEAVAVVASGTWGTCAWEINNDNVLTIHEDVVGKTADYGRRNPWHKWAFGVSEARTSCAKGTCAKAIDCSCLFMDMKELRSVDLSNWDTSSLTSMRDMFYDCYSLASLDLSGWDTSSVYYMEGAFSAVLLPI